MGAKNHIHTFALQTHSTCCSLSCLAANNMVVQTRSHAVHTFYALTENGISYALLHLRMHAHAHV